MMISGYDCVELITYGVWNLVRRKSTSGKFRRCFTTERQRVGKTDRAGKAPLNLLSAVFTDSRCWAAGLVALLSFVFSPDASGRG